MKQSVRRTRRRSQKRGRSMKLRGGAVFTTQEKDNLIKDGGFTQEHLNYLASLPENFRSLFGSFEQNDYNFIKAWQMSVSDLYDIPPTPENMKTLAEKTIEDFKYYFERRGQQDQQENQVEDNGDITNELDANISSISLGGRRKRRYTRRRSTKRH